MKTIISTPASKAIASRRSEPIAKTTPGKENDPHDLSKKMAAYLRFWEVDFGKIRKEKAAESSVNFHSVRPNSRPDTRHRPNNPVG